MASKQANKAGIRRINKSDFQSEIYLGSRRSPPAGPIRRHSFKQDSDRFAQRTKSSLGSSNKSGTKPNIVEASTHTPPCSLALVRFRLGNGKSTRRRGPRPTGMLPSNRWDWYLCTSSTAAPGPLECYFWDASAFVATQLG